MKNKILIVGGAGYIGTHMAFASCDAGFDVTVIDNLSRGNKFLLPSNIRFEEIDLLDFDKLYNFFKKNKFDAVIHFAAFAYVGESVENPYMYYKNNTFGSLNLIEIMRLTGHNKLIFSSTCATYGIPDKIPISETQAQSPINPYGSSKLFVENIINDYFINKQISSIVLRYFNVAGCDIYGRTGEIHIPETHLIPNILISAILKKNDIDSNKFEIFGNDFDTYDGTCIRDYIHVNDLCHYHLLATKKILSSSNKYVYNKYNLGSGDGYSVMDIFSKCNEITGIDIDFKVSRRRAGDPPVLVANPIKAQEEFGYVTKYSDLETLITSAWNFFIKNERKIINMHSK